MKKSILWPLGCLLALASCAPGSESLVGNWAVDKINVQFDENRSTPELVRQIGEMEKGNTFSISRDSILCFTGMDESFEGRVAIKDGHLLYCGKSLFGEWRDGTVTTKTDSPLGEVVVTYRKQRKKG